MFQSIGAGGQGKQRSREDSKVEKYWVIMSKPVKKILCKTFKYQLQY